MMMPERRKFLIDSFKSFGLAAAEGLSWSEFIEEDKSAPLILRPPGSLQEDEERLKDVTEEVTTQTPRSSKKPLDYLNEEEI